jgi:calcium/calmodulin-dependent protein kinase I
MMYCRQRQHDPGELVLCGYFPFRSESLADLTEETKHGRVVFHERYWKDVSQQAKDFIGTCVLLA